MINRSVARSISIVRHNPSAILLLVQLLAVIGYPFLGNNTGGRLGLAVISLVALAIATWSVYHSPAVTYFAILTGAPALVFAILEVFNPDNIFFSLLSAIFHALFYFYASYAMIRYVMADSKISADEIFSTIAAFTVILWAFAYLFLLVNIVLPNSYNQISTTSTPFFGALFLSFTTLTSVGLSDVYPTSDLGRAVFMIGELVGLFYMAFIVGRVVSLSILRIRETRQEERHVAEMKDKTSIDSKESKDLEI